MAKINLLDKSVFELIAAGEVIERPASVIKELIENSIDSGAKHISVEIKNGGTTFMRITDDGCGMAFEDIPTAFLRHATSKVKNAEDLERIFTLGFRGEALASVAAVAHVEVLTKESGAEMGSGFKISGGEITEHERIGCPDGTTMIVRDLFYNVPARRKFLKKDVTEGNQIQSLVDKLALAHPDIAFRFIRDNKSVRDTSGNGDYYSAIYSVFGKQFAMSLIPLDFSLNGISVTGYISSPLFTRGNRSLQYFYVNGRSVRSVICMTALEEGYRNSIMVGKFPACVLDIVMPPELCDVNVSPSKTDVRFADEKNVFDAINFGVRNAILNNDNRRSVVLEKKSVPTEKADLRSTGAILFEKAAKAIEAADPNKPPETNADESESIFVPEEKPVITFAQQRPFVRTVQKPEYVQQRFAPANVKIRCDEDADHIPAKENGYSSEATDDIPLPDEPPPETAGDFRYINSGSFEEREEKPAPEEPIITTEPEKPPLRVIGEAFGTYILCTSGDQFIMIDKHAAHERIRFEERKLKLVKSSQLLAESIEVPLSAEQYTAVEENIELLSDVGIDVILGDGKCEITAAPSTFMGVDKAVSPEEMLIRAANSLAAGNANITAEIYGDFLHSRACKSAIKAHDSNSREELEALAQQVWNDERICPHGRPIMIKLSEYDLEKYFSRIQ